MQTYIPGIMGVEELKSVLERTKGRPAGIASWQVKRDEDSIGQDAVWVWVTLKGPLESIPNRSELRDQVRRTITEYAKPEPSWVYVRFLSETDPVVE